MNYPSKSRVNVAVSRNNTFDLSRQVVTTHDFGRVKAIECRYMVPGDKFNYKISSFTRLLPMVSPTFGKIDCIQRAYFVPIRTVCRRFYDWVSNQPIPAADGTYSVETVVPYTTMHSFVQAFVGNPKFCTPVESETTPNEGEFDFYCDYAKGSAQSTAIHCYNLDDWSLVTDYYFRFTSEGRKLYDFFVSLGFNISFEQSYRDVKVNMLPFLCFWKFYLDWVVPSRFVQEYPVQLKYMLNFLEQDENGEAGQDWHTNQSGAQWFADNFMHYPLSFYQNDYFNASWLKPFQPQNMAQDVEIANLGSVSSVFSLHDDEFGDGASISDSYFNYFSIQSLQSLQDYLNRGMLAGTKVQDWLMTEFGLRPSTDALQLSTYLGKIEDTIRIGDVMSMADTTSHTEGESGGQLLGAYAGQAKGGNVGTFEYSAKEHGYFIITNEIIPKTSYTQGLTPEFSMIDRFDFFQPEFDNMGVQAIYRKELFSSTRKVMNSDGSATFQAFDPNKIFGFAPRYANLKCSFDTLSGDFCTRFGTYLKSWYLNRDVEKFLVDADANGDGVVDLQFGVVNSDLQNWQNIFSYVDDDIDHFYQIFVIENRASRPMLSIAEALNPEHPNGNKEVTIKTHGGVE